MKVGFFLLLSARVRDSGGDHERRFFFRLGDIRLVTSWMFFLRDLFSGDFEQNP